jgi:hypothetical protein
MADGLDLSEIVKRTAQANAKFYKGWMDLSLEYVRGLAEIFGGPGLAPSAPVREVDTGAGALVLEGESGSVVRGSFLVTNDLDRQLSCEFVGSDFRDPTGLPVQTLVRFDPPDLVLGPSEQRVVQVVIPVSDALAPGVGYAGQISIKGMDGFAVPVVLRRQHPIGDTLDPQDSASTEQTSGAGTGATAAQSRAAQGSVPVKKKRRGERPRR